MTGIEHGLSIVIPAYNEANYIEDCVVSIVEQDFPFQYEVLVRDDGSTDRTHEILTELADTYPPVTAFRNEKNIGRIGTLQRLMEDVEHEFVLRIDGDSMVKEGTLQATYEALKQGSQLVFGKVDVQNTESLHPVAAQIGKIRGRSTWYGGGCVGVQKSAFSEIGGYQEQFADAEMLELEQRAKKCDWKIQYLEQYGIDSHFPTELRPVLKRKYRSLKTHVRQYDGAPEKFNLYELRGPLFWSVFVGLSIFSFVSVISLVGAVALLAIAVKSYWNDAKLAAEISGKHRFLLLYPAYRIIGGLARTVGCWSVADSVIYLTIRKLI